MIKELFKDIIRYLPSIVIPSIIGIFVLPIYTRLFPPEDYGNYILVITTVSIFTTFVSWLSMSVIRFYPACERDCQLLEFFSIVTKWLFISIAILVLVFFGFLFAIKAYLLRQLYHLLLISVLVCILSAVFEVLQSFLRARRQVSWYVVFSVWKSIATLGIGLALVVIFYYGIDGLLWGAVLATVIAIPLLLRISIRKFSWRTKSLFTGLIREMAKYSFPLVLANLAAWILSLSDRYILELFRGSNEVGIYSVSYQISEYSILLVASLFTFAFNPLAIIIWEKQGCEAAQEFLHKGTRYFLLLCIPVVVGISVLRDPVVFILAAPGYYEGAKVIPLVTLGGLFLGLQQRFSAGLSFYKKTHLSMFCTIAAGLLNLGLNFLLIPKYGYIAAAATTLVSYAFLLLLMIFVSRRFFVWEFPFKSLGRITFASLIMALVVYPIGNSITSSALVNLIMGITVGAIVYIAILFMLREHRKEEIQELRNVLSRVFKHKTLQSH